MKPLSAFCLSLLLLAGAGIAQAQATRTWVSGVGDDANPCSRTAPCKTFAGAISKTAAGGEIDALDPGGFGAVTITKSLTIDGGGGQVASILVAGTNGIVIYAQSNDVVTLRNIRIQGLLGNATNSGNAGLNGVNILSAAKVTIDHCFIDGFGQNGINVAPNVSSNPNTQVTINDTTVQNSMGDGLKVSGLSSQVTARVAVWNSRFFNNNNGVDVLEASAVDVRNSASAGNAKSGFVLLATSSTSTLSLSDSQSANNRSYGVRAYGVASGTQTAKVFLSNVSTSGNVVGVSAAPGNEITSYKNNAINEGTATLLTGTLQ